MKVISIGKVFHVIVFDVFAHQYRLMLQLPTDFKGKTAKTPAFTYYAAKSSYVLKHMLPMQCH